MKLASLKGPTRDGTLVIVNRDLTRAVAAAGIAPTMQHALENWDAVSRRLKDAFESSELPGLKVAVSKAGGEKCQRCWVFSEELGRDANHPNICPRCLQNLG